MAVLSHPGRHNHLPQPTAAVKAAAAPKKPKADAKKAETTPPDAAQAVSSEKVT